MAASEAQRKGETTSPNKSGESHYETAVARYELIQHELERIGEGKAIPRVMFRDVRKTLELARDALGPVQAKQAQLEATDGRPLTVCLGRHYGDHLRFPELRSLLNAEIVWDPSDGCGVVFADATTSSRPVFARYCPVCREFPEARRRAGILARSIAVWAGRFAVAGGWRLTCTGCGERFFATTPQRRRCDRCQH
jgi:ribosomal protein L33